jgi:hypothetical protein
MADPTTSGIKRSINASVNAPTRCGSGRAVLTARQTSTGFGRAPLKRADSSNVTKMNGGITHDGQRAARASGRVRGRRASGFASCRTIGRGDRTEQGWLAEIGAVDSAAHRGAMDDTQAKVRQIEARLAQCRIDPCAAPGACGSICEVVSLAKAPTDSVTPTTKLARPFYCLVERVESADRQFFQFRRRYSERFGSIARPREHTSTWPLGQIPPGAGAGGVRLGPGDADATGASLTSC